MKLLVVGATGPQGKELVQQAIAAGHQVTALARRPDAVQFPAGTKIAGGDVLNVGSLVSAARGQDAVISSLGSALTRKPITMLSEGTRNLVDAMKQVGVRRLICITGIGAGDSKGHGGFLYDRIIQPLLLNEIYKDKTRQEAVVEQSGLDWTLVRPAQLTNGPRTGQVKAYTDLNGITTQKISRADTAAWILERLGQTETIRHTYTITKLANPPVYAASRPGCCCKHPATPRGDESRRTH